MQYSNANFEVALNMPRFEQPLPSLRKDPCSGKNVLVVDEQMLMRMTMQWFAEFEAELSVYQVCGLHLEWLLEWTKKYWYSWRLRDRSCKQDLYAQDVRWRDASPNSRVIIGIEALEQYHSAFLEVIPDWRYDPIPGHSSLAMTPNGETHLTMSFYGSGHWTGPLQVFPYAKNSPVLNGRGIFIQKTTTERYHFNKAGKLIEGETFYNPIDSSESLDLTPGVQLSSLA